MADLGPVAWPPEPIRTERLVLRAPEHRDRAALIELLASPEVGTYLGGPRPPDEIERELPAAPERPPGLFVVDLDGAMIGQVILKRATGHGAGEAELGYLFLPQAWGFGYAAEACAAALAWLDNTLPGQPAVLKTQTANARSMRLAAKLGFTEIGRYEAWGAEQWFGLRPAGRAMGHRPPSAAAVDRAAALAGPNASVQATLALSGGTHARTYLVRTASPERQFVLREFPVGDHAVNDEVQVLGALDGLGGLAPRLLAADPGGPAEEPWILISRLPGLADITPADPSGFARQLGETLARIHATAGDRLAEFPRVRDRPGESRADLHGPAASLVSASWESLASEPAVLTHYDFWSGNTVWQDGTLTGVVDWSGAALGPRSFDVGWCRLDLYLLFGQHIADRFLESYQAASGVACPDSRLADLWAAARSHTSVETWVPNYRDLGRSDLTAQVLRERHTAWTRHLIE
jgi:RimJ/RimL family protein N-acetyltransferase/aminoglycoside phosphotransferase (APT) family kinase protein